MEKSPEKTERGQGYRRTKIAPRSEENCGHQHPPGSPKKKKKGKKKGGGLKLQEKGAQKKPVEQKAKGSVYWSSKGK